METQTPTVNKTERSGIAKVKWSKLDIQVPKSEIILGGVDLFQD